MQTDYENIADLTNKLNQWDLTPDITALSRTGITADDTVRSSARRFSVTASMLFIIN